MTTVWTTLDSPLGELLLVGEESTTAKGGTSLTSLSLTTGQPNAAVVQPGWAADPEAFAEVAGQLRAYFAGESTSFELEFTAHGTPFQRRVWAALEQVPHGHTLTYGELAERAGIPRKSARAVGAANGANPLLVVRPCHRVIGANGSLTGYAAGLERKQLLLELEGRA
ncbi:methylated-DNA--[protein]-cysteine S-methyltransferase [Kitasatospora sp. NPDC002040]|uniref:methylated-DNA--[protein]-cysteine S-methyltransferase n=1 Tax=Kitasatospora sp. NPDC002040 TaxID=3154661 RepID=UPI00331E451C